MTNRYKVELYRKNKNNPLRAEYLKEYKQITESKFGNVWIVNLVLAIVIGIIFFSMEVSDLAGWVLFFGIVNLVIMALSISMSTRGKAAKSYFSGEIKELDEKYEKKGYVFDGIDSVVFGDCYDFDNGTHIFTCPFTGETYYGIEGNKKCVQNSSQCPIKEKFIEEEYNS